MVCATMFIEPSTLQNKGKDGGADGDCYIE